MKFCQWNPVSGPLVVEQEGVASGWSIRISRCSYRCVFVLGPSNMVALPLVSFKACFANIVDIADVLTPDLREESFTLICTIPFVLRDAYLRKSPNTQEKI